VRALLFLALALVVRAQEWTEIEVERAFAPFEYVLLLDQGGTVQRWNRNLSAAEAFLPWSTFKLPHALIALDAGVIGPELDRRRCRPSECHADHGELNLEDAIRESCVSYFRQTARAIGPVRMAADLAKLGYPATGPLEPLDGFWLAGGFKVTPEQQLHWIRRFYTEALPVAQPHLARVRSASLRAPGDGYVLHGKTGTSGKGLGWFVGQITWVKGTAWVVILMKGPGASGPEAERRLRLLLADHS
jgi:beta-lactamase class D